MAKTKKIKKKEQKMTGKKALKYVPVFETLNSKTKKIHTNGKH